MVTYDSTGDAAFSSPLSAAIIELYKLGGPVDGDVLRAICHVAWQAEYYRTRAPMLTGVNLEAALNDLANELGVVSG